ncbi:hypothetical protein [Streptomyces sp.]|uniref:hypothetical protein n=1 Tax=Streptomyces sp. TaxID=1931 RepID=UPI0028110C40|nr:hypothetical protein [Streptomyces sp.]
MKVTTNVINAVNSFYRGFVALLDDLRTGPFYVVVPLLLVVVCAAAVAVIITAIACALIAVAIGVILMARRGINAAVARSATAPAVST